MRTAAVAGLGWPQRPGPGEGGPAARPGAGLGWPGPAGAGPPGDRAALVSRGTDHRAGRDRPGRETEQESETEMAAGGAPGGAYQHVAGAGPQPPGPGARHAASAAGPDG
ncbi:MAG TPA: hypothetical protein VH637_06705, partial [Streptosporangiaceae bacterium]